MKGFHIIDLFKYISMPSKKLHSSPPAGWSEFLNTLLKLNIPQTAVANPHARDQYLRLKMKTDDIQDLPHTKRKKKLNLSPRWITPQEKDKEEETPRQRKKRKPQTFTPDWISS